LRKSEALFELGSVARTDVLQARVNRATSVQELISARNAVEQERARLAVLLGLDATEPLEIRLDLEDPALHEFDEDALIRESLEGLPEVRRARAWVHGAEAGYRSSFWSQLPTLNASLFYGRQITRKLVSPLGTAEDETGGLDDLFDASDLKKNASWGWSVGFSWNVFDGFNTIGSVRSAKASVASAKEEQRQQELQAALGVREALVAIANAEEGIRAAEEAVELAAESLKLQEALYENGGGTILELNNAQVEHTRAQNSLVEARIGLHLALATLDRALGI
jgi:outer membrane protein TolC